VDAVNSQVYLASFDGQADNIKRCNTDGSGIEVFVSGENGYIISRIAFEYE
jgi:hypothetical protein